MTRWPGRNRGAPVPLPEWIAEYEPAEWITAEDLEGPPPRYPGGAEMPLDALAYQRFMAAARAWLTEHDYSVVDSLQVVRAARLRRAGFDDRSGSRRRRARKS